MTQDELKKAVAAASLDYIEENTIIGVGTGSTSNYFIECLAQKMIPIRGAVASSLETEKRLKAHGIPVIDFNNADEIAVYIDSADSATPHRQLIKGGQGALTREKILAYASKQFICILDESKMVDVLGESPVPIEVIPMARSFVAREVVKLGGSPVYRQNFTTDNGNIIIDIHQLSIVEPVKLEKALNDIPGIVCNGLFAERPADLLLISTKSGMKVLGASHLLLNKFLK